MKSFVPALISTVALSMMLVSGAHAAPNVLYFTDGELFTDSTAGALSSLGITPTLATDQTDFATKLGGGTWDLAILDVQANAEPTAQTAMDTFVTGGGRGIYSDWTRNNTFSAAFDAVDSGPENQTSMNVLAPLATGIINPVTLVNPAPPVGWHHFSHGLSALPGGTSAGTFASGDSSIMIGNGGRTIMNGFTNDVIPDPTGQQLYVNEIHYLLGPSSTSVTPEPCSLALLSMGGLSLLGLRRRRAAR